MKKATFSVENFSIGINYVYEDQIREDYIEFEPLMNVVG
jgi:hypothetical protein